MHLRLWCRRCKLFGDRNRSISGVILLVCHGDNVISGVCLTDSMCCECVRRFVVCDGSGNLVCVSADDEIAIYVDFSLVLHLTGSGFFSLDAGILVDDHSPCKADKPDTQTSSPVQPSRYLVDLSLAWTD